MWLIFFLNLKNYLNKYKYSNAIQDNLWEELTKQAHIDQTLDIELNVKNIMDTWTLQKGYPVVYLNIEYDNNDTILLSIKQNWFLLNTSSKKKMITNGIFHLHIRHQKN